MKLDASNENWEDGQTRLDPGYRDAIEAAWYLTKSPVWTVVRHPTMGPFAFGVLLALVVVAVVLFSPSTDSHFIYTDF